MFVAVCVCVDFKNKRYKEKLTQASHKGRETNEQSADLHAHTDEEAIDAAGFEFGKENQKSVICNSMVDYQMMRERKVTPPPRPETK